MYYYCTPRGRGTVSQYLEVETLADISYLEVELLIISTRPSSLINYRLWCSRGSLVELLVRESMFRRHLGGMLLQYWRALFPRDCTYSRALLLTLRLSV